jgi:hypothetical protein
MAVTVTVEPATRKEIIGTGFKGYIEDAGYADLVQVFGQPDPDTTETCDGKIRVQWIGRILGMIFTIYDYKDDRPINKIRDWHIGGKEAAVAELVQKYFEAARPEAIIPG